MNVMFKSYFLILLLITFFIHGCKEDNLFYEKYEVIYDTSTTKMFDGWEISKYKLGFEINVRDMYFVNAETGFIVGYNGEIYKTTNAGKSWQKQYSKIGFHLFSVFFLDENIGFASSASEILKTMDGGCTWKNIFSSEYVRILNLHFFDNLNGLSIIITDFSKPNAKNYFVAKTSNGGVNWEFIDLDNHYATEKFYCFDNIIFVIGENQKIFKSKDQGNTWETIHTPIPAWNSVRNMYFYNENIGYIDGISNIYKTVDGGLNWETVDFPFSFFNTFHFYNESEGFGIVHLFEYVGSSHYPTYKGSVGYQTYDGGMNWNKSELISSYYWELTHFVQRDLGYGINHLEFFTIKRFASQQTFTE